MKETKFNWKFLVIYTISALAIFIILYPTFFNVIICSALYPDYKLPGIAFLNWKFVFSQGDFHNIFFGCTFLWIAGAVAAYATVLKDIGSNNKGTEHGSARFLTDKEFDALVPNYDIHKNEYEHLREDSEDTHMNYLKTSNVNIFEDIDFVSDNEVSDELTEGGIQQ